MDRRHWFPLLIVIALFALSALAQDRVQFVDGKLPVHWNARGEVDGYGGVFAALWLLPLVALGLFLLFVFLPYLEVFRQNLRESARQVFALELGLLLFFLGLHLALLAQAVGERFNLGAVLVPLVGALFVLLGVVMRGVKRNFFIGIRTPWTLSSDAVWRKTHALGGALFALSGVLTMLSAFALRFAYAVLLVTVIGSAVVSIVYSFILYAGTALTAPHFYKGWLLSRFR